MTHVANLSIVYILERYDVPCDLSMAFGETEKINAIETVLKQAGFILSERCYSRPCCFDFVARRSGNLILIKVQSDTEKIAPSDYIELKAISDYVSATSLLISEKSREKPLEDDTVYSRHNIIAVNERTFENIVLRKTYPLIRAGPGGYYVEIDGKAIKRRRQKLGLSIGELAGMTGVSRRTLYGYERGMAKSSVSTAYNLICTLGMPVAKPIDVFEEQKNDETKHFLNAAKETIIRNKLLRRIFMRLARYNMTAVQRAPFDFLINSKEKMKIVGGVVDDGEEEPKKRVNEILSFSRVVQAYPVLVTEKQKTSYEEIPCICSEELSEINKPEDLVENSK